MYVLKANGSQWINYVTTILLFILMSTFSFYSIFCSITNRQIKTEDFENNLMATREFKNKIKKWMKYVDIILIKWKAHNESTKIHRIVNLKWKWEINFPESM